MQFTQPYSLLQMSLLSVLFGFMVNGYSFFKVLYHPSLVWLGEISYSLYLLHGVVIYVLFYVSKVFNFTQPMAIYNWYFMPTFLVAVIVAYFAHKYIEIPFYKKN